LAVDIISCFKFGLSFFLSLHWGVFFLPWFGVEVWLINLYICRQGWNLVQLGMISKSIWAKLYLYGALMGAGARCWVGRWGDIEVFFICYILFAWRLVFAGTVPPGTAEVDLIDITKMI